MYENVYLSVRSWYCSDWIMLPLYISRCQWLNRYLHMKRRKYQNPSCVIVARARRWLHTRLISFRYVYQTFHWTYRKHLVFITKFNNLLYVQWYVDAVTRIHIALYSTCEMLQKLVRPHDIIDTLVGGLE